MSKRTATTVFLVSLSLVIATGCIGRMALSGKVMKWNLEAAENKWGREVIFLCLYIIPVYPISGMIDLLIVNSIEFHTGTNPVSGEKRLARAGETRTVVAPDGTQSSSTLREDGSIDFEVTDPDGGVHSFNLQEHGDALVARDFQGHELARVRRGEEVVRVP